MNKGVIFICDQLKRFAVSLTTEVLAMWFAFWDRRVRWYVKLVIASGVLYAVSPYDLIADTMPFWGQLDDLIVLRVSYVISRKILDEVVLGECRQRATTFLGTGRKRYIFLTIFLVWGVVLLLVGRYLSRKFGNG